MTRWGHLWPGAPWYLHVGVGRNLLGTWGHWDLWMLGHALHMVRHSRGHLWVGMGQEGLRCWLRSRGYLRVALRRPWHGAWHHLWVLRGYIALWSLVALGHLMLGLIAILWMLLHWTWKCLPVLRGNTRLRGHISMRKALLGLDRWLRARNGPWSRLVSLRQLLPNRLRVLLWLLVLLWLRYRRLARGMNRHSWLGHKLGISPHLRGYSVAR